MQLGRMLHDLWGLAIISQGTGPQTSDQAELQPPAMISTSSEPNDTLTLDNQAVVKWGSQVPHGESSGKDNGFKIPDKH